MPALLSRTAVRRGPQPVVDAVAWVVSVWAANAVRWDFERGQLLTEGLLGAACIAVLAQLMFGVMGHLYRGRYRFGSFDEVLGVVLAAAATAVSLAIVNQAWPEQQLVPRSVPFAAGVGALTLMVGIRYAFRLLRERRSRPASAEPLLLFGAGEGADQTVVAMLRDPDSRYLPVGLLDDDARKRNLRLRGVPVLGNRSAIARAAERTGASSLLIAIPTADAALVREVSALAEGAGLLVKVLPPVGELIDGQIGVEDIRDLDVADLLGRRQVETDLALIAHYLTGKRVLVTGAGGSIGSELCRQISQYGPAQLIMLDRDESALHAVQLSISGRALLDDDSTVLADIRDVEHLSRLFSERRPHVVFHAAALKHLPLLQRYPGEAIKSNVWGTLTVLQAAQASGVDRFVNISTDKAAAPENVLGFSKRIAERLTAHVAAETTGTYLSVRFGNVLGSRGSVLTTFQAQIAAGGPITVTDPDVTRFFMTVQEAVQLVIQAGAIGRDGEVLVLDMGQPVRIADVAHRLAAQARRPIQVVFTGLRPGEKLHEDLLAPEEVDERPVHPLISHTRVPPLAPQQARMLDAWAAEADVVAALERLSELPEHSGLLESP